ncbi:MAG TPA: response regulator [Candidatus Pseudogracilibacillus intestinigallinarum]|uniref:Response regulator n=1 Tax=Candidatus Pseudogracilibacillus intestinigallinarum TaxID=2838742 RepID=A0A9D1PPA0_9BACI|nr:response regulator [Candidatus Pseudogracilibacillus intestinigallinarum]
MGKKILLVEDESIIRMDLKVILETEGYEVIEEANNGEKAVELALTLKPDIILMDIKMPKIDGLKASRIIGKQLDVPIVIITAYSQKEFIEKAQQDNIVGYIVKPISKENLIPAIEIALHQAEKKKALQDDIILAKEEVKHRKLIEKAKGIVMDRKQYSEQEAFTFMRENSMKHRMSMYELSEKIIKQNEKTKN